MIEKFKYQGMWWIPGRDTEKTAGRLSFDPQEGITLDLIGSFQGIQDMTTRFREREIILGALSNGKNVTLCKCSQAKSSRSFPGSVATSSSYVDRAFVGVHFQKKEDITFKRLSVRYSFLDEWVDMSAFDVQISNEQGLAIKDKELIPIQATVSENLKISIVTRVTTRVSRVKKEAVTKQRTYVVIEPSREESLEEYFKTMYHIQNFLSLAMMRPIYPLGIEGATELNKRMMRGKPSYPPIEIFYKLRDIPRTTKLSRRLRMLFSLRDISDKFEPLLKKWFEKADSLEPVYSLYFGTRYNPRMYLEHQFLSLTQAVESFHRRVWGGDYLSDGDYGKVYAALVNAIPPWAKEDFRESLKKKIHYRNEFSLGKRIKDILDKYQEIVPNFIRNKKSFTRSVVDTRNYHVHYEADLKERAVTGEDFYRLTQKVRTLLEICLLAELGFSLEEIRNLFFGKQERTSV